MKTRRLQIIVVVMAFLMAIFVVQAHIATAGQAAPSAAPTKAIVWNGQSQFAAGSMEHKSFERASQMITQMSGGRLVANLTFATGPQDQLFSCSATAQDLGSKEPCS